MDPNAPFAYRSYGYIEDLEKITPENLYEHYKDMLKKDMIDIFVLGDIDFYKMEQLIKENFVFHTLKSTRLKTIIDVEKVPKRKRVVKEKENITQSKLAIGCRCVNLTEYERNYPLTLYNILLGGSSDSKLFLEVREKNSLAYTIRSIANKLDNIVFITAGIASCNFDKTLKLIEKAMKSMEQGDFLDEDIEKAKKLYSTSLDEIQDQPGRVIESYYMMQMLGTDDIETRRKKMMEVTREEIIAVSKKIKMDMVYLLEGKKQNEEN